ncbi:MULTISPECIES: hypothetical protein [Micrococcaceae]|uniref:hypothetical protein n=1 Tax=Micrococcaceae TaxID=1268 RepID=UPI000CFD2119|nr:hypothetical protein [Arthrobacter sp. MYb214]PRB75240.1 hypothetical protein CQ012_11910 [Arthrobacter sp. MYb214]
MGKKISWPMSWLAAASGILFAVLLLIVDPLIADAPWWSEPDLWVPLAFPLLPWLAVAGVMAWLGSATERWLHALVFSFSALAAGVIPGLFWTLLLFDAFPDSASPQLPMAVSLFSGAVAIVLGAVAGGRAIFRRFRKARLAAVAN